MSPSQGSGRYRGLDVGTWHACEGWAGTNGPGLELPTGDLKSQVGSWLDLIELGGR